MSLVNDNDELVIRARSYRIPIDIEKFEKMPENMYDAFVAYHRSLPPWSASGAINCVGIKHVSMHWDDEEYFPENFIHTAKIFHFSKIGIVYGQGFTSGYIFDGPICSLNMEVLAIANGPSFSFGINDHEPFFRAY